MLISYRHGGEGGVKADSGLHNWLASDACYQHRNHKRRNRLETTVEFWVGHVESEVFIGH